MKALFSIVFFVLFAAAAFAQTANSDPWPNSDRRKQDDESHVVKEMLAKQQTAREKKEYANLVERSEAALKLSEELETAFGQKAELTDSERKQLESFEKLVSKIRDDLGGEDNDEAVLGEQKEDTPEDVREGFRYLKRSTERLVSEIKKSTRFSVSVVAIESSNTLIRLARFLRLKN